MSEENDFFLKQMKGVTQIKKKNREPNLKTTKKNNHRLYWLDPGAMFSTAEDNVIWSTEGSSRESPSRSRSSCTCSEQGRRISELKFWMFEKSQN